MKAAVLFAHGNVEDDLALSFRLTIFDKYALCIKISRFICLMKPEAKNN